MNKEVNSRVLECNGNSSSQPHKIGWIPEVALYKKLFGKAAIHIWSSLDPLVSSSAKEEDESKNCPNLSHPPKKLVTETNLLFC